MRINFTLNQTISEKDKAQAELQESYDKKVQEAGQLKEEKTQLRKKMNQQRAEWATQVGTLTERLNHLEQMLEESDRRP
eukprot:m.160813 g.160813  ORF g.160813 m.160813 type:complete len:79 (+) comp38785_c0_seq3:1033-1269(+)